SSLFPYTTLFRSDLGDAIDVDQLFGEFRVFALLAVTVAAAAITLGACHPVPSLKLQAALAGGVGQRLDPAVKQIGAAIEDDAVDAGRLGPLGEELPDGARRGRIGAGLQVR